MRKVTVRWFGVMALLCVAFLALSSCGVKNAYQSNRGRGDAPVGNVQNDPAEVIQMPDGFSNIATKCDGHGHRVYVTTRTDSSRFMVVVDDPNCGG